MTNPVSTQFSVQPSPRLAGTLQVPGDKSISHRSVMFASLADGVTDIHGFLPGEDCQATLTAFRAMGVHVEVPAATHLVITGVGIDGLYKPASVLDMGNSGTAMRLLAGILAGQAFGSTLTGDSSLCSRPMGRIVTPLSAMGAAIETAPAGCAPLEISPGTLHAIDYRLPIASAQVKSCLLLAGLYAEGRTRVQEPASTRDHTERFLAGFGYPVETGSGWCAVRGGGRLTAAPVTVPGDLSSAAFFLVAASIAADADITLTGVGINPTRFGVIEILQRMGANIEMDNRRERNGEPVADLRVRSAALHGIDIPEHLVPLAIDEFPVLFVAAAAAAGTTRLTGAAELRVKESDRIQAMTYGLVALGVMATPTADGIIIEGGSIGGGEVDSLGDHRIAMAFAIAGVAAQDSIKIADCANVATSFPNFVELAQTVGMAIEQSRE